MPKFSFLLDVQGLCYAPDCEKLKYMCENLGAVYSSDVDDKQLYEEILYGKTQYQVVQLKNIASWRLPDIQIIVEYGDESLFPNLGIALQVMLTMAVPVSVASCERSFSKLKLIASYFRTSTSHDRLCDLL